MYCIIELNVQGLQATLLNLHTLHVLYCDTMRITT